MTTVEHAQNLSLGSGDWTSWTSATWTSGIAPQLVPDGSGGFLIVPAPDATLLVIQSGPLAGYLVRLTGSALSTTGDFGSTQPTPLTGTIEGLEIYDRYEDLLSFGAPGDPVFDSAGQPWAGQLLVSVSGLSIDAATLQGLPDKGAALFTALTAGQETVIGSDLDDRLQGGGGNDQLEGRDGNDTLEGGAGGDTLDGAGGSDTADYTLSAGFVNVSLLSGFAGGGAGSHAIGDTFDSIENLTGSAFADRLSGDGGSNVLEGGTGADTLNGNGGSDTASYAGSSAAVTVSLLTGFTAGGDAVGDVLTSIENLRGSGHDDLLLGDTGANRLEGGDGDDTLRGRDGADILVGGAGRDAADYMESGNFVNVSLLTGFVGGGAGSHALGDTLVGIEDLIGSRFADRLSGDNGSNFFVGGEGGDTINGNGGDDFAIYGGSDEGVNVSLLTGYTAGGHAAGDVLSSIENLGGSGLDDTLSGDNGVNLLAGGSGDDILRGRDGGDLLVGGEGSDFATYDDSPSFVNVSLLTGYTGGGAGNHAAGDQFFEIENLAGSSFADRLNGDNRDNALEGRQGADTLDGNGGSDTATYLTSSAAVNVSLLTGFTGGGAGNHATGDVFIDIENLAGSRFADILNGDNSDNVLEGGRGGDVLRGNGGSDTASYTLSEAGVNVSLLTGFAGGGAGSHAIGDSFSSIENLLGSDFDDILNGDNGDNSISGGRGQDLLRGNGGADTFVFDDLFGWDTIADFTDGVDRLDFRSHSGVNGMADIGIETDGADARIFDVLGQVVRVVGAAGQIDASDFIF